MRWFLDAGNDSGASHSGGQRPKSARHEVAGGLAPGRADRYGDLIFAPVVKLGAMRP
jgi:hypothetical protein